MSLEVAQCVVICDDCEDYLRLFGIQREVTEGARLRGWTRNGASGAARRDWCPRCSEIRRTT